MLVDFVQEIELVGIGRTGIKNEMIQEEHIELAPSIKLGGATEKED
jgi:hypothetical protein